MSREVLRDAIVYLPAKVVPALLGVLAIPILTRLLTPEQYGQYLLAMTSLTLIASFFISWLISVTIRFNVVYGVEALYRTCRPWLIGAAIAGCVVWVVVTHLLDSMFSSWGFVLGGTLWLIAYSGFEYYAGWLRARNFAKAYSLALSWRSIAGLLSAVGLLLFGFQGGEMVIIGAACSMLAALAFLPRHALHQTENATTATVKNIRLRAVLKYGLPVAFSNVVITGLSLADRYVIGAQMGTESVAIYGANYDLAEKTIFFANSMLLLSSSVIGFRIFEQEGEDKAAAFLSRLMRLYLLAAPFLGVALAIHSPHIIAALLPAKYAEGALVLPIVALGGLFVGVMHRYSLLLSFHKRTDLIMWCSAGALLVNVLACFILIPSLGLVGAAISTSIAYACWLLFIRIAAIKYQGPVFPWLTLVRVCSALAVAAGVMYALNQAATTVDWFMLLCSFTLGLAVYALSLFLLREVPPKDVLALVHSVGTKFRKGNYDK